MSDIEQKVMAELKSALDKLGIAADGMGDWSKPAVVETARGTRLVTNIEPNDNFWDEWRENKDAIKEAGFGVSKHDGKWRVAFWLPPEYIGVSDGELKQYKDGGA